MSVAPAVEHFLSRLAEHADDVRAAEGGWLATCPACGEPGLRVEEHPGGWVGIRCFGGGCDTAAVLDAMGLTWADLDPRLVSLRDELRAAQGGGAP